MVGGSLGRLLGQQTRPWCLLCINVSALPVAPAERLEMVCLTAADCGIRGGLVRTIHMPVAGFFVSCPRPALRAVLALPGPLGVGDADGPLRVRFGRLLSASPLSPTLMFRGMALRLSLNKETSELAWSAQKGHAQQTAPKIQHRVRFGRWLQPPSVQTRLFSIHFCTLRCSDTSDGAGGSAKTGVGVVRSDDQIHV